MLVLGLPHGAVDHLAVVRVGSTRPDRPLAAVAALYLLAGGAYLGVWLVAPAFSFALFVALTWVHWGQGDCYVLVALPGRTHLGSPFQRALCVLVRGGLPMVVPLLAFPGTYREVARAVIGLFDPGATAVLEPLFALPARLALGALLAALSLVALVPGYRRAIGSRQVGEDRRAGSDGRATSGERRRAWRLDAGETLFLWAYFLAVPPILAVGLYFCLWHSLRYVVRVIALGDGDAFDGERTTGVDDAAEAWSIDADASGERDEDDGDASGERRRPTTSLGGRPLRARQHRSPPERS